MKKREFDYSYFWDDKNVDAKKKVYKGGKLNCSSNELIHPKLTEINEGLIKNIKISEINSYIYCPQKIEKFSSLLKVPSSELQLFAGSDDAIKIIITALGIKCKKMILQTPNYENYSCYARLNGYEIYEWKMNKNFEFEKSDLEKIIEEIQMPALIVITSPNGFTGYQMSIEELNFVIDLAEQKNCLVVIDQAYAPFANIECENIYMNNNNVIVISTFSKGMGLPGARIAYVRGHSKIVEYLRKWNGINCISALSFTIAEYYNQNKDILEDIRREIIRERERFIKFINDNTVWHAFSSQANFVLVKCRNLEEKERIIEFLLSNNIIVRNIMYKNMDTCFRMTIVDKKNMDNIIRLINYYLEENKE